MPELPEVETVKRILEPIVKGETISAIKIYRKKNILNDADYFISSLVGETFTHVSRLGKYLIFHLTHKKAIISHLRMEGKYFEGNFEESRFPHDIMRYEFLDGKTLRYNDVRTFGTIEFRYEKDLLTIPPLSLLALDPFSISLEGLESALRKTNRPIKEAIMDQHIISGIGNIYADETLFAARINPLKKAKTLSKEEVCSILKEARRILTLAIKEGGSTIKSYHPKEGVSGLMQNELLVYGKSKSPCPRCTFPLKRIVVNGRGTTYCPVCQKGDRPLIIGVTGPIASGKSEVSKYLEKKGYEIIDADKIVASLYKEKSILIGVKKIFGQESVTSFGLNRDYCRKEIAKDGSKKTQLEKLVWPKVFEKIEHEIRRSTAKRILLDVPLLIGSPLEKECDLIIYIEANRETQAERLSKRGKDVASSLKMNESFPRKEAKKAASILLDGNGSVASLQKILASIPYL